MYPTSVLSCSFYSQTWVGLLRAVQNSGREETGGLGEAAAAFQEVR